MKLRYWLSLLIPLLWGIVGCSPKSQTPGTLRVWVHSGLPAERQTLEQQVQRFHASQSQIKIELTFIPERSYNAQVQAAALANDLPDILEFDGPFVYNYVWQKNLIPLDPLISPVVKQDLLPSILQQGSYRGQLYSVGTFDSGLGLYARRSHLQAAGIRIPKGNQDAWTVAEFNQALAALAQRDPDRQVLDLKLNYRGEWLSYGFAPMIQSAGGDLIRRPDYQSAHSQLNSPAAIGAMQQFQSWLNQGYVDPNIDDAAFTSGRVSLSWVGHWVYPDYAKAVKQDLVLLPLPNFGQGSKTAQGSWNWGITRRCREPKSAMQFLEFLLQPREVLAMASANGAVPGTRQAIARSPLYAPGGPLQLFASQLLAGQTVPRPQTPAYPVITSAFQEAVMNIRNGRTVQSALDKAVTTIDLDIQDNGGYPVVSQAPILALPLPGANDTWPRQSRYGGRRIFLYPSSSTPFGQ
jgi:multiple sugar transport system substrate-binding protein